MNVKVINLQYKVEIKPEEFNAIIIKFPQKKNKNGRPSLYTTELINEICFAIMNSDKGIERLCKEHHHWPSKKTIFNWLKKNEDFKRLYEVAKEIQIEGLMDELLELPSEIYIYTDKLGNRRVHPLSIELMRVKMDKLKWKTVHLIPRKYKY